MQLTVIGSSDAFNSGGSGNACYWLDSPSDAPFMVDFGCTALQGLRKCGRDPDELDGILFTHLHGDHFGGFAVLHVTLTFPVLRERRLTLAGPRGLRSRLERFLELAYGQGVIDHAKFEIDWIEMDPGDEVDFLGRRVEAFAAEHEVRAATVIAVGGADDGSQLVVGPENDRGQPVVPLLHSLKHAHEVAGVGTLLVP